MSKIGYLSTKSRLLTDLLRLYMKKAIFVRNVITMKSLPGRAVLENFKQRGFKVPDPTGSE